MKLRSLLFVPGDRPERFEKAAASGADAVIIDLEDSVAQSNKARARDAAALQGVEWNHGARLFIRVNPLSSPEFAADMAAVGAARPFGILLPKAEGAASIVSAAQALDAVDCNATTILPIATETPISLFRLDSYQGVADRLCGLTWGAEDLSAAIGATTAREADGTLAPPYQMVRALALFGAHAAGTRAIETVFPALRDRDGLAGYAAHARRDGFSGMLALHPDQVPVINAAFSPSEAELAWAERVVAALAGGGGVADIDGQMIDLPHLKQAQAILSRR